jgi:Fe2+ or Zn2+ uptake regulation protein
MYYNTNKLSGSDLIAAEKKTQKQEEIIRKLFLQRKKMTASQVHELYPNNVPLTSIRRAITNLKNEGILVKLSEKVPGMYGSPEHFYTVRSGQLSIF